MTLSLLATGGAELTHPTTSNSFPAAAPDGGEYFPLKLTRGGINSGYVDSGWPLCFILVSPLTDEFVLLRRILRAATG